MSLGIYNPEWKIHHVQDAHILYADPDWWGRAGPVTTFYEWQYHPHLVAAANVLKRRWRVRMGLRWAKERWHWSEASHGHLRWRKSGCGWYSSEDEVERPNARGDKMLLAAAYRGDESLVRTLLAKDVNLDCVEAYSSLTQNAEILHMPLDVAVRHGHGEIACWILEKAGSGTLLRGMHPECVPSACGPGGLLWLCHEGAKKLFTEWNEPTANVRYHQTRQRRALAKAVYTLLQSSHVAGKMLKQGGYPQMARYDEHGYIMYRYWLVDARMPGVLMGDDPQGWVYTDSLLKLAWWAEHTDLAARLYLAGVRCRCRLSNDGARICETPEYVVRFVARAVVRTLLRRYVKTRLIMWYWREAGGRSKYAAPDTNGFETEMAAPVFSEGALGA